MLILLGLILFIGFAVVLAKVAFEILERRSRRVGLTLNPLSCPKCGTKVPHLREPNSMRQEIWGGWTCSGCGVEMDRNGTEIGPQHSTELISKQFGADGKSPIEKVFEDER